MFSWKSWELPRTFFSLLHSCYSTVLVLTVSSFSTAVSPPSVQVVVMETLQETAVTWHTINARSHTAVMEYGAGCIWVSVCDSLPQRGGIFFLLSFFSLFPGSWGQWGIRTAKANLSFKTGACALCFRCVCVFFACLALPWRLPRCPGVELHKPETQ